MPFEGLEDLRFGTPRLVVRALLNTDFETFEKGESELDSYDDLGFHLYYDGHDRLEFIEAFEPCDPMFNGVRLLGDLETVLRRLGELGYRCEYHDEGYHFAGLGFVLYIPLEFIEVVSIYRRGYYGA